MLEFILSRISRLGVIYKWAEQLEKEKKRLSENGWNLKSRTRWDI